MSHSQKVWNLTSATCKFWHIGETDIAWQCLGFLSCKMSLIPTLKTYEEDYVWKCMKLLAWGWDLVGICNLFYQSTIICWHHPSVLSHWFCIMFLVLSIFLALPWFWSLPNCIIEITPCLQFSLSLPQIISINLLSSMLFTMVSIKSHLFCNAFQVAWAHFYYIF